MKKSLKSLEVLGRIRLSPNFFLRDFLYSEISQYEGIPNIPKDELLAIKAGRGLCENILEPIQEKLGNVSIRSAYREMMFYPKLAAFNINWYSGPLNEQKIGSQMANPATGRKGILTRTGMPNISGKHAEAYVRWLG